MRPAHSSRRWLHLCVASAVTLSACSEGGTEPPTPVATSISLVSGGNQIGLVGAALSEQLVVKVSDQLGAPMQGAAVAFGVTGGNGSVSPASATTDASGLARSTWTLGPSEGAHSAQVSSTGLAGSPIAISATATTLAISSIAPETLVEGADATIAGTGFDVTGGNYVVTIDGVAATITASTPTELTIVVPSFDCLPQRTADVQVRVSGTGSNTLGHPVNPAGFVDLAVGEMLLVDEPDDFCLQLPPAAAGSGDFLVGVGAAGEVPSALMEVTMTGVTGQAAPAPSNAAPVGPTPLRAHAPGTLDRESAVWWRAHFAAEQRLRQWEREFFDPARRAPLLAAWAASAGGPIRAAAAVPSVGDTLAFHVPNFDNTGGTGNTQGACDSISIATVVRAVGSAGIFVTDVANPTGDSLTDDEIQALSDTLDAFAYPTDTLYFGVPADIDGNQRMVVVLTIEVNKLAEGVLGGFAGSQDLVPRSACASSDEGEIVYLPVPDPSNTAGTIARPKDRMLPFASSVLAHEAAHIIQLERRLSVGGSLLADWEREGQAVFAQEVYAHAVLGNGPGQDYGAATAFPDETSRYGPPLRSLGLYYGDDRSGGRHADAPEECTLYLPLLSDGACEVDAGYGASWSFFRYVADRYGAAWAGGEAALMRDWIGAHPSLEGVPNVEALLGVSMDSLFAKWAAMHYVDGRVPGADPALTMPSWDLAEIMPALGATATLQPAARGFADFSSSESIRGGSTAYTLFSGASARPAVAIRVRDRSDAVLGTGMRPQLWVVRVQ